MPDWKGKMKTRLFFVTIMICLIYPITTHAAQHFRCGPNLVSVGDSKNKVIQECGPPTSREDAGNQAKGNYYERSRIRGGSITNRGSFNEQTEPIEIWYYNCGDNQFSVSLTFISNELREIENESYGSGESDCIGAERREERQERKSATRERQREKNRKKQIDEMKRLENKYKRENEKLSRYGTISLKGTPRGAFVYLDGVYIGDLPCELRKIEDGPHYLKIIKEGYIECEKEIYLDSGETLKLLINLESQ